MNTKFKILITALLFFSFQAYAEPLETGHKVGMLAPGFELKSLGGTSHSLQELTKLGHVLLVFWATDCVYCYAHIAEFKKLHTKYSEHGFTLAAINIGGEYHQEVKEYADDNELNYLVLSNRLKNLDVAEAYRVFGTPTMVLVSPAGKILYRGHEIPELNDWIKLAKK